MRIQHIIVGLNVGGAELMLKRLIQSHLGNVNYCHSVISLTSIGAIGAQLRESGVEVRALGMRSLLGLPRVLWALARIIKAERPHIVQTWMYHADLVGGVAAHLAGNRRIIWGVRTTDIARGGSRATVVVRRLCALLSGLIPHSIVCAARASCESHAALGYDKTRMVVVPNGFDMDRTRVDREVREAFRSQFGWKTSNVVIGSVGRFNWDKDHESFIRAAGMVAKVHPQARFVMVGRDLTLENHTVERWLRESSVADRFTLLGERSDVLTCFAAMDIFCLHSRTEGFPNVLGEAMAMGLPCVTTDVGDAANLIGDATLVVPKENHVALAERLIRLVEMTAEMRTTLGGEAKERIQSEFTMGRCRERFENIYSRVVAEGGH